MRRGECTGVRQLRTLLSEVRQRRWVLQAEVNRKAEQAHSYLEIKKDEVLNESLNYVVGLLDLITYSLILEYFIAVATGDAGDFARSQIASDVEDRKWACKQFRGAWRKLMEKRRDRPARLLLSIRKKLMFNTNVTGRH